MVELRREMKRSVFEYRDEVVTREMEVRTDPLTGLTCRILEKNLEPSKIEDFSEIIQTADCPFCAKKLHDLTPVAFTVTGESDRTMEGDTVLVPNLYPYADYCGVLIFRDHFIALKDFNVHDIRDGLVACTKFIEKVQNKDRKAVHSSINWNYMNPSGGTLLHPHLQALVDSHPTHVQRLMLDGSRSFDNYWKELLEHEMRMKVRYIRNYGKVHLITSFSPLGHLEVAGIVEDRHLLKDITKDECWDIARAMKAVQSFYCDEGRNSFNMAMTGSTAGSTENGLWVTFRMVARANLTKFYRSDVSFMERLHLECVTTQAPEIVAERFRRSLQDD